MERDWRVSETTQLYKELKERARTLMIPWFDDEWDGWEDDQHDPWVNNN